MGGLEFQMLTKIEIWRCVQMVNLNYMKNNDKE